MKAVEAVEAADILLGTGRGKPFSLKIWGGWFHFSIKPISARGIIKISRELSSIQDVSIEANMFKEQMDNAENLVYICNSIAIATRTRFKRIVSKAISKLELSDIHTLWSLLVKNSDPKSFFFIMVSAGTVNQMKTTKETERLEEATQSSAE